MKVLASKIPHPQQAASFKNKLLPLVEPKFLFSCQQELAELIGPIASLVCRDTLNSFNCDLTEMKRWELVEALAGKIPGSREAGIFRNRLLADIY